MDYEIIRNDNDFHEWHSYAPIDGQYVKYSSSEPSIIAAGHKIEDVYYCFANARVSFMNAGLDNYGDISGNDDISKKYTKSHFLTVSLLEYAICLDISWQVIWAYTQPSSFEYLINQKYKEMEKECTSESVHSQLNCIISQNGMGVVEAQTLKQILTDFENDSCVKKLRSIYNGLKHQGTIHFQGLGEQLNTMMMSVGNKTIPTLGRKSYTLEEIESLLFKYHFKFKKYFNSIIQEIMPPDYKDGNVSCADYIYTVLRMNSVLNDD